MNLIASFLGGSAVGALIKSIIDIWAKKIEHKNSMQIKILERKLNVFENAVMVWYSAASNIEGLSYLFENLQHKENHITKEMFQTMITDFSEKLAKIDDNKLVNAVFLYTDIEEDVQLTKRVLDSMTRIQYLLNIYNGLGQKYQNEKSYEVKEDLLKEIEEVSNELRTTSKKLSIDFSELKNELMRMIKKVKQELEVLS